MFHNSLCSIAAIPGNAVIPVIAKLSTSKFASSLSLSITPDAALTVKVASSLTAPVSATPCGPTPVTVIVNAAVSVFPLRRLLYM